MRCKRCKHPVDTLEFKTCSPCREQNRQITYNWRRRNPEKSKASQRRSRLKHREKRNHEYKVRGYWKKRRFAKYGLTESEWQAIFLAQQERCAACRSNDPGGGRWHTDHDHVTGQVRGILCHQCNVTLGLVKDSPQHLLALIGYLEKPSNAK